MRISIQGMFKAQLLLLSPWSLDTIPRLPLTVHNFHSPRSIPCRAAYHGATDIHVLLTLSFTSYRVPIYTPGSRAAMCRINCLAEGQKCRAMMVSLVDVKIYACSITLLFILILLFRLVLVFECFDISKLGCFCVFDSNSPVQIKKLRDHVHRMGANGNAGFVEEYNVSIPCRLALTRWRLVPSILWLGSMGNACYSKIKSSSTG